MLSAVFSKKSITVNRPLEMHRQGGKKYYIKSHSTLPFLTATPTPRSLPSIASADSRIENEVSQQKKEEKVGKGREDKVRGGELEGGMEFFPFNDIGG